ncbi:class I SAM-dependent methyltransferase [Pedobacter sp. SYP-B3415]|uniref:class I SAM-dependent methyltransferase n=1 Tax=Pedobacter sp. SYP-B3415 TaxID=2496641 RepID=UPI00101C6F14|nr:class I SAM-dependent methyltransferase [Pedobacter sp. SYP-B3415]
MNVLSNEESTNRELARQLRCPDGENGLRTAIGMEQHNTNMIRKTVDTLAPTPGAHVLEIGFGNGSHLDYLFQACQDLRYTGVDISETMVNEAQRLNAKHPVASKLAFLLTDGLSLPFGPSIFDCAFSVNTVYFWEQPLQYAAEIRRVVKPGGALCLGFADHSFMTQLPFTQYGFKLYDQEKAAALMHQSGFHVKDATTFTEHLQNKMGESVERVFHVMRFG